MIGSMPHNWLFPRKDAVVHHGGAGTTAAGLRAGIPAIVTPHSGDQPSRGQRVYELEVGPRPIPRQRLRVDRVTESIRCAVSDTTMREKAARLVSDHGLERIRCAVPEGMHSSEGVRPRRTTNGDVVRLVRRYWEPSGA